MKIILQSRDLWSTVTDADSEPGYPSAEAAQRAIAGLPYPPSDFSIVQMLSSLTTPNSGPVM
jgi:hypothetical protein